MTIQLPQLSGLLLAGGLALGLIAAALMIFDGAIPAFSAMLRGSLAEMGPHLRVSLIGNILWAVAWVSVLAGFGILAELLVASGDQYLARLSLIGMSVAVVLALLEATFGFTVTQWAIREAAAGGVTPDIYTVLRRWVGGIQVVYIALGLAAHAGFGAALLQTGFLPSAVGRFALIWSLGWLVVVAFGIPAILFVAPAVIGVALILT